MRWSELLSAQPALGAIAHEQLIAPGVLLVGTVRRAGIARISAVEPLILDGDLWLSMMSSSTKARDLARDRRIVLNSIVTARDTAVEIKIVGEAVPESDRSMQERYAAAAADQLGWRPVAGRFRLFRVSIDDVTYIGADGETHGQHIARWPANEEYVRPWTTPTSLGPPVPVRRILTS
ncbi:hypothetical protein GCM10022286_10420 [Gryllotalpicola daejeonensis]|uniref:Pyridoxamine 5'-phosphate oxidase putative domain-containing protein n=1 Tax=Gryllotalpicola daejeonensis TaxID=993087 RepID=A0ABP7ZHV6_9MICO